MIVFFLGKAGGYVDSAKISIGFRRHRGGWTEDPQIHSEHELQKSNGDNIWIFRESEFFERIMCNFNASLEV